MISSNSVTIRPNPLSNIIPSYLSHFEYTGRLVAKGLFEKLDIDIDLSRSFLKHILCKKINQNFYFFFKFIVY